jgi:Sulfate permease and related transporters (MFS superfamily)
MGSVVVRLSQLLRQRVFSGVSAEWDFLRMFGGKVVRSSSAWEAEDLLPPLLGKLRGYGWSTLRADFFAAIMVAIVTIPQAIGFSLIVGLPVTTVLTTAVVGGVMAALVSSSPNLIFGPTNTVSILVAGALLTVGDVALPAEQKVLVLGLMIGAIQLGAGLLRLGTATQFISRTVVISYTLAVALLIGCGQLGNLFGLAAPAPSQLPLMLVYFCEGIVGQAFHPLSAVVGLSSLLLMLVLKRVRPNWPEGLIVIVLATAVAMLFELSKHGVKLVLHVGEISGGVPSLVELPEDQSGVALLPQLGSAAVATALLGLLETVSITKTLAARAGQRVAASRELSAVGLGNLASAVFGGMPGSTSFVRSAVCAQTGARTQIAAMVSSGLVLAAVAITAGFINEIPIPTVAAYLILVAKRLIQPELVRIVRQATGSDTTVFWGTLMAALFLNLDTAVFVGVGLSLALFLRKASAPSLVEYDFAGTHFAPLTKDGARSHPAISIVHVEGELFFGAADLFQDQVTALVAKDDIRVVILRMKNARHLDATTVLALLQLHAYMRSRGQHLLISGIAPDAGRILRASGAWERIGADKIFPAEANPTLSTKRALQRASELIKGEADVRIFVNDVPERSLARQPT